MVEMIAEERSGTCRVCKSIHKKGDVLVHGCACRGTEGFMHLGCLLNLLNERDAIDCSDYNRNQNELTRSTWNTCQVCGSEYHYSNSRECLVESIRRFTGLLRNSSFVLGTRHPITQKVLASLILCFDEQLDWSVDDIPAELLAVRPLLDDVPPDIADRLADIDDEE